MTRLLTVKECAELLGLHPVTVQRYCREGVLEAEKIWGEWRIPEDQPKLMQRLDAREAG